MHPLHTCSGRDGRSRPGHALDVLCASLAGSFALAFVTGGSLSAADERAMATTTAAAAEFAKSAELRVMTFNIRYAEPRDGGNRWEARREAVAAVIDATADIAGLQEALEGQLTDLRRRLPAFEVVARGRERDPDEGEACPVLFRRERFEKVESGTFWLSDAPEKPGSRSWGATLPRICTWAELRERGSGRRLRVYNAHLDNAAPEARRRGLDLARRRAEAWDGPVLLLGDFNEAAEGPAVAALRAARGWRDLWTEAGAAARRDGGGTFNAWRARGPYARIDYVFMRGDGWTARDCRVERPRASEGGGWASDHFPVVAVLAPR